VTRLALRGSSAYEIRARCFPRVLLGAHLVSSSSSPLHSRRSRWRLQEPVLCSLDFVVWHSTGLLAIRPRALDRRTHSLSPSAYPWVPRAIALVGNSRPPSRAREFGAGDPRNHHPKWAELLGKIFLESPGARDLLAHEIIYLTSYYIASEFGCWVRRHRECRQNLHQPNASAKYCDDSQPFLFFGFAYIFIFNFIFLYWRIFLF